MRLKDYRIFYVEDDARNRAIVEMILEHNGAKVGFERWGRAATLPRLYEFMPIDLILLDLMFPNNVTGYDIFNLIRDIPQFNGIPIVAISAADPTIEMARTRNHGFDGFISKPINLVRFPFQIEQCIAGQKIWQGS